MRQAASDALMFVEGLNKEEFAEDKRTQQAVIMSLVIIGEAATKVRNRIAHGYFDINLDVVWETVQVALPELLTVLPIEQN